MKFLLLGPLTVRLHEREVQVSAPRQRVVLATLLLNANHVVSVERIARYVWDGAPPPSAAATVRTYVMRLRQALGEQAAARIVTRAPGYLIALDEQESDLGQFTAHRRRAACLAESGDLAGSAAELVRALSHWRDDPLADIPSQTLRDVEGRYLNELRLQTLELRFDAELALRRHAELVPELWRLVREHPMREALVGRLMLALFRSGRQSEALDLYQRTRSLLVEQLGAEPSAALREMQRRILSAEDRPEAGERSHPADRPDRFRPPPATGAPAAAARSARPERPVLSGGRQAPPSWDGPGRPRPAQLPAVVPVLTARAEQLQELHRILTTAEPPTGSVTTAVVTGRGGIGKSALALRAAHAVRGRFPHGQLYADLGGGGRPLAPGVVLLRFLTDLGVPRAAIPAGAAEREALYRSLTSGNRVLVLLDDAHDSAQIRPLVPGSGGSRLLVTSRRRLAELDSAQTVALPPLDEAGSLELLAGVIGAARVEAEPQAARQVVAVCAGLPLAVRIAGARQLERPHRSLADLAQRLTAAPRLLDELHTGGLGVRPCLDADHTGLRRRPPNGLDPAAVFSLLGATNAAYTSRGRVAALLGCSEERAEEALDALVEAHLLHPPRAGRYRLDALLQAYARERAQDADLGEPTGQGELFAATRTPVTRAG
ncbi:AfsR/SARP family transcriptional regulator [Streptacidiphilus sp. P02-A3a]|uniref:AfsR/SARP family transcriptional regulator n=1 Tax=Streptacidiphilus sp. P02-A3a TaxID=2704468 RepID=UPI0015FB4E69|nr:AfsR/SARP family transcriptional regulator [Streptacidiphilus sp. P02-A3a]QMU70744.1 AfsR family transcriptional regulator [Streptacidiphilus sp. P02-A3a]